jgi:hypothetical protein
VTMEVKLPRLVAIDSSILASWARDSSSHDSDLRTAARKAQTDLLQANWIPIICLHHFIELGRHSDVKVGTIRFNFLKSFPQIAWLGRSYRKLPRQGDSPTGELPTVCWALN